VRTPSSLKRKLEIGNKCEKREEKWKKEKKHATKLAL
jgi:hypothetical protein